jgi:hypothetical protein
MFDLFNTRIDMNQEKILRTLDSGFFMDHREQEQTAALIRGLQERIDDALGHLERGTALDVLTAIRILKCE